MRNNLETMAEEPKTGEKTGRKEESFRVAGLLAGISQPEPKALGI
jgi:hypothetical protein